MRDGTRVYTQAGIGGMSEVMTAFEEYCVPIFSDLPAAEMTLLGDQLASGFAAGHADMRFEPGSDVAVFGAGPVGIGAIQAGRVTGAGQVIAIDPIPGRAPPHDTSGTEEVQAMLRQHTSLTGPRPRHAFAAPSH